MAYRKNNPKKAPQCETTPPALIAWHVSERGEKKFWNRIGAAWEHEDDEGLTLQLDPCRSQAGASFSGCRSKRKRGLNSPFFLAPPKPDPGLRPFMRSIAKDRALKLENANFTGSLQVPCGESHSAERAPRLSAVSLRAPIVRHSRPSGSGDGRTQNVPSWEEASKSSKAKPEGKGQQNSETVTIAMRRSRKQPFRSRFESELIN
jgi:hypothetical protein